MALLYYLPSLVKRPLSRGTELVRGAVGGLTWGPVLAVAKPAILSAFSQIEVGTLLLVDEPAGTRLVYGQKLSSSSKYSDIPGMTNGVRKASPVPRVELAVKKEAFWIRLFMFADMGFAEAFMLGEIECADLTAFFQVSGRHSPLRRLAVPHGIIHTPSHSRPSMHRAPTHT